MSRKESKVKAVAEAVMRVMGGAGHRDIRFYFEDAVAEAIDAFADVVADRVIAKLNASRGES